MKYKLSKYANIIQNGTNIFIIHSYYGRFLQINNNVKCLLEFFKNGAEISDFLKTFDLTENQVSSTISELVDLGFLLESNLDESNNEIDEFELVRQNAEFDEYDEFLFRLYVTTSCNMRCDYCFERSQTELSTLDIELSKNAIIAFKNFIKDRANKYKKIKFNFFGGEPLLYFEKVKKIHEYAREHLSEFDNIIYTINTNGTLLTSEIISWLISNDIHISISLDGTKEINDKHRVFPNRMGTYDIVVRNLERLTQLADVNFLENNLTILSTITEENIDELDNFVESIRKIGIKNISLNAAFSCALGDHENTNWSELSVDKLRSFVKKSIKLQKLMYKDDVHVGGMWGYFQKRLKHGGLCFCQAVGNEIGVMPDGKLYPCPCVSLSRENSVGELKEKHFEFNDNFTVWQNRKVTSIEKCKDCYIAGICRGGCPASSVMNNRSIFDPIQCDYWKMFFDELVSNIAEGK